MRQQWHRVKLVKTIIRLERVDKSNQEAKVFEFGSKINLP